MEERIQKIIANAGYCSRRKAEELIEQGKVKLNGNLAKLGDKATIQEDKIEVGGSPLKLTPENYYYTLNKPKGLLVTKEDPQGRKTIYDLDSLKKLKAELGQDLNYVGRLDGLSEGLLILTNDGELTNLLTHPKHHVEKTYQLRTDPEIKDSDIKKLKDGLMMDGRKFFARITNKKETTFDVTISEGRNRIIRNSMAKLGYKIFKLNRISIDNIKLGNLKSGEIEKLDKQDIKKLKRKLRP